MQPDKHSIAANSLETTGPEIGVPEFTELRHVVRPFPKDAAERASYLYLVALMQNSPDAQQSTKAQLERYCRRQFGVTVSSFETCWRAAIEASGASWDQPGRRPRR